MELLNSSGARSKQRHGSSKITHGSGCTSTNDIASLAGKGYAASHGEACNRISY